jgi:hypothetical protein
MLANLVNTYAKPIADAFAQLGEAIMRGIGYGIARLNPIALGKALAGGLIDGANAMLERKSPSKVFMRMGNDIVSGLALGLDDHSAVTSSVTGLTTNIVSTFQDALSQVPDAIAGMGEFQPVITPVLDLTSLQSGAKDISTMFNAIPMSAEVSSKQANIIATTGTATQATPEPSVSTQEVHFNQTINSPGPLSPADIYRNTRSQIALAKEELKIP